MPDPTAKNFKRCKCGRKMAYIKVLDPQSNRWKDVPVDLSAPVYQITKRDPNDMRVPLEGVRVMDAMVNHFNSCPVASEFSGRKKK